LSNRPHGLSADPAIFFIAAPISSVRSGLSPHILREIADFDWDLLRIWKDETAFCPWLELASSR
jgi:hypothetical protein